MAQHTLSRPEIGAIEKNKTGRGPQGSLMAAGDRIFTATGAGTTTTMVGAAANLSTSTNCARIGERFVILDTATGKLKEDKVFQVTAHNGTTTITFTPAAAVATASGDRAIPVGGTFADNDGLDQYLLAAGGVYTQAYVDKMTQNDKVYAIRQMVASDTVK